MKYSVSLPNFPENEKASIRISKELLETYHIDKEELIEACVRNMEQQVAVMSLRKQICTMAEIDPSELEEGESEFPEITVVTIKGYWMVQEVFFFLLSRKEMEQKYGSCFAILPSSRHEVLVAPLTDGVKEQSFIRKW